MIVHLPCAGQASGTAYTCLPVVTHMIVGMSIDIMKCTKTLEAHIRITVYLKILWDYKFVIIFTNYVDNLHFIKLTITFSFSREILSMKFWTYYGLTVYKIIV